MNIDEQINYAREVVGKDPMALFLGIEVEEVKYAYARLSLFIKPQYLNAVDRAHGMAISAIADQSVAVASNATEYMALVVELKVNLLDAVSPGDTITAEARAVDMKRKLSLWEVEVRDSRRNKVAVAQALAYHRPKKSD